MEACRSGHVGIVDLILEYSNRHQIDLNVKDRNGWTAFNNMLTITSYNLDGKQNKRRQVLKRLLEHPEKIDFNAVNNKGYTALVLACLSNYLHVVQLLLGYAWIDVPPANPDYDQGINDLLALASCCRSIKVPQRRKI